MYTGALEERHTRFSRVMRERHDDTPREVQGSVPEGSVDHPFSRDLAGLRKKRPGLSAAGNASATASILGSLRSLDVRLSAAAEAVKLLFGPETSRDLFRGLHITPTDAAQALRLPPVAPLFGPMGFQGPILSPEALTGTRFEQLRRAFELSPFDLDVVLLVLAPEIDTRYERLYAFLQDDIAKRRPTIDLALNLLSSSVEEKLEHLRRFRADAPLLRHGLVRLGGAGGAGEQSFLSSPLAIDEALVCHLLGHVMLDARIASYARLLPPVRGVPISRAPSGNAGSDTLYLRGLDPEEILATVRRSSAGRSVLVLEAEWPLTLGADWDLLLDVTLRSARLAGHVVLIQGIDRLLESEQRSRLQQLLRRLLQHPDRVYLSGAAAWRQHSEGGTSVVPIDVEPISVSARKRAWAKELSRCGSATSSNLIAEVASRFELTRTQLAAGARHAVHVAGRRGAPRVSREDLYEGARVQTRSALLGLADRLEVDAGWRDLVLPSDTIAHLQEVALRVVERNTVLGEWGVGRKSSYGKGTAVLFAGPSGTGKTFAAAVLARETGLDLHRIDLSGVVSKYIGETEKNLARIFVAAERANSILLFDEAEALFGKRSEVRDAHDRYANQELAYLLQAIEHFDGMAILTTNMPTAIDEAFRRRLAATIYFPLPDEAARHRLWEAALPSSPIRAKDVDIGLLASRFKLSGGVIAQAARGAAYLAAEKGPSITMNHVLRALRREFDALGIPMPSGVEQVPRQGHQ